MRPLALAPAAALRLEPERPLKFKLQPGRPGARFSWAVSRYLDFVIRRRCAIKLILRLKIG